MWLHYSSDQKPLEIFHIPKFFLFGKLKYIMESHYITCPHEVSHKETCLRKISVLRSILICTTFRQKTSFHPVDSTLLQKQIKIHIKHTPHKKMTWFCINLIYFYFYFTVSVTSSQNLTSNDLAVNLLLSLLLKTAIFAVYSLPFKRKYFLFLE